MRLHPARAALQLFKQLVTDIGVADESHRPAVFVKHQILPLFNRGQEQVLDFAECPLVVLATRCQQVAKVAKWIMHAAGLC